MPRRREPATLPALVARRRSLALLLAGFLLLQTLWVAHHLASERHLTVAGALAGALGGAAEDVDGAGAARRADDEHPHVPHLAIDHEVVRERCAQAPQPLGPGALALPAEPPFVVRCAPDGVWTAPQATGPPPAARPGSTSSPRAPPRA